MGVQPLLARWRHEIQIALQQRRAAMARAVLPRMGIGDNWMLSGHVAASPSSDFRQETLEPQSDVHDDYEALRTHPPPGVSPTSATLTYDMLVEEGGDFVAKRIEAPPGLDPMVVDDTN